MVVARKLLSSKGLQQSVITVGGTFFALGISAVTIIVISRVLGPEAFGIFSLVFALVAILIKLGDVGFSFAIQTFLSAAESSKRLTILHALNRMRLLWILMIWTGLLILSPVATAVFQLPAWWVIPLSLVATLASIMIEHVMAILQALEQFIAAVGLLVAQSLLKLIVAGAIVIMGVRSGAGATILYFLLPGIVGVLALWWWRRYVRTARSIDAESRLKYLKFLRHNGVQVLSTAVADNLDIVLVQVFLGVFATGVFGGVTRISLLVSVLALSVGNVLNVRVAKYTRVQDQREYLRKVGLLMVGAVGACALALALAPWLIISTVGREYLVAVGELRVLLIAAFISAGTIPLLSYFYAVKRQRVFSVSGLLLIGSMLLADLLLIPTFGLMGAAIARLISRVVVLGYVVWEVYSSNFSGSEPDKVSRVKR